MSAAEHQLAIERQASAEAQREATALRLQLAELQQRPFRVANYRDGQEVTRAELDGLSKAQSAQRLQYRPGEQVQVICRDDAGRPIRYFFGDPAATWDVFDSQHRKVTGWNTKP